jgi:hypothetical protein
MNQKLVDSLTQIILSLTDDERRLLNHRIEEASTAAKLLELQDQLKEFEIKYAMSSDSFRKQFQSGELGDSADFFEWNAYYEMLIHAQADVA